MIDTRAISDGQQELQFDLAADDQALFLAEVDELLQRVEELLVDLERAPDDQDLLNEIFRAAHTIKGSSTAIGHTRMAALTHAMETRLDDVRKGTAPVTPQLVEALLTALDVLKVLRDEVETRAAADIDVEAAAAAVERRSALRATWESSAAPVARAASSTTIRIDVARLDALLNLVGELVIDRTRLVQLGGALIDRFGDERILDDLHQTALHIGRITDDLQEQVMKSRMLPIETVFNRLPRVVRDVAARQGKQIELIIEGKDTELDRSVIEEIRDPLLHLIRNGVDHGIETPEERKAAGKSPTGTLRLSAQHAHSLIVIALEDDGRGIDVAAVKCKAVERGVISQEQADRIADTEAVQLIFAAGLSTADKLTDVSGRGVGMDVVRANVEKLNGSVEVETRPGKGTTFTIRLPLTLAIVQALLVRVGGGIYALPIHSVTETLRVEPHKIHHVNRHEAIVLRDRVLPLVSLPETERRPTGGSTSRLVVAVHTASRQAGLIVDALVGEQEIVIKPLGQPVGDVGGISGAAILGDGNVALMVDVAALIEQKLPAAFY